MQKIRYITNKDLLAEIKLCKASFCYFIAPEYAAYDAIVTSTDLITAELISEIIASKAHKQSTKALPVDPVSIDADSIVFRVMTDDHLPPIDDKNKRRQTSDGDLARTNFSPFRHYILKDGELIEVGRSHWKGDFVSGGFYVAHGKISNRLATMFMLLVERYARGASWRGYSYNDEMQSHALMQLSQVGLQFDESRSDNPFAFFTQIIKNCFSGDTKILTREYGAIAIAQVAGQDVTILDGDGNWTASHIYDYGLQETVALTFSRGDATITLRTTLDHGWVQQDTGERIETEQFVHRNGFATREVAIADLRPSPMIADHRDYHLGIMHGSRHGEVAAAIGRSLDFLRGFLRGWLASDDSVSLDGGVSLRCDEAEAAWVSQWAPLIGWTVTGFVQNPTEAFGTVLFAASAMTDDDFLLQDHKKRFAFRRPTTLGWRVNPEAPQTFERRLERVYCPDVQTTHSLALAGGIHSFQCFRRVLNLERRVADIRDDLLIMAGAKPSYTRQTDIQLDHHKAAADTKVPPKRGRKPKNPVIDDDSE